MVHISKLIGNTIRN